MNKADATNKTVSLYIKPHAVDNVPRLQLGQLSAVYTDATFLHLHNIRLCRALMQVLQEREETVLELDV